MSMRQNDKTFIKRHHNPEDFRKIKMFAATKNHLEKRKQVDHSAALQKDVDDDLDHFQNEN